MINSFHYSREKIVAAIAAVLVVFTAWSWGGVVLWTQWTAAGLGLIALAFALLPTSPRKWQSRSLRLRLVFSIVAGMAVLVFCLVRRFLEIHEIRQTTIQLIPDAEFQLPQFSEWGEHALVIGLGTTLLLTLISGFARPSGARCRLVRFPLFWLGLFVFAWITCQSLNPWAKVIQRDMFWSIAPQEYISWLPSGLAAPFDSSQEPGGMNGWRQILIYVGPWAMACALHIAVERRRVLAWLAVVVAINGIGVALVGNIAKAQRWRDFLGFTVPDFRGFVFGPFVYQNHAGVYLYLCSALALSAMFHLAKNRGHKVDQGGPHLLVGFAALVLLFGAASTLSIGAGIVSAVLLFVVVPWAYFFDKQLRTNLSALPAFGMLLLAGVVCYAGLMSFDARAVRQKIERKHQLLERLGTDDRAPLRLATWNWISSQSAQRQASGGGAGSFRWLSPTFLAESPEFLDSSGKLNKRATHAHNDWLQAILELGIAGWVGIIGVMYMALERLFQVVQAGSSVGFVLIASLALFFAHAYYDFLLFVPLLTLMALVYVWSVKIESEKEPAFPMKSSSR